ncbi:hypothetical protein Tam10B_1250 [Bifidobacterium vansinderenii]|uniref:Uncharacterized protein n=1 Tax=Bifidobacterium vansinderenii TaxID=1984871 RepID=A0A229VYA7_9BIFI|nr:hypothetical protein [Bifidobacterium vansinderenii]OXN00380.1 hypothetical protein Tam10B_1250 [Bifidobacterium vansinderenii]
MPARGARRRDPAPRLHGRPALQPYAYGGDGSQLVRRTQEVLESEGVYSGRIDGLAGPKYIGALPRHLGVAVQNMKPWTN